MNAPKFTPGPWKRQTRTGANRWRIVDARGHQVADINHYNEQAEHNADLIAAAPELHKALSEALWMIVQHEGTSDANDCIVDAARSALAKAVAS